MFSPAGMATKGFFGLGVKNLGNPGGATSGGGGTSPTLTWRPIFTGFQAGSIPNTVWVLSPTHAVVGCLTTGQIVYTANGGTTWTPANQTVPARQSVFEFASNAAGTLVAYGSDNTGKAQLSRSTDHGATWTDVSPLAAGFQQAQTGTSFGCVQWNDAIGRFVCFALDTPGTTNRCFTSADGLTWTGVALNTPSFSVGDFRIGNGLIVVVGLGVAPTPTAAIIQRSADRGATWATVLNDAVVAANLSTVEFNGTYWDATGANATDNVNYNSLDAITWTLQNTVATASNTPPFTGMQAAAGGNLVTFANPLATDTQIGVSQSAGVVWAELTIPNPVSFVLNIAGVLYGFGDGISASADGIQWISQLAAGNLSINCVRASGPASVSALSLAVGQDALGTPTVWKFEP